NQFRSLLLPESFDYLNWLHDEEEKEEADKIPNPTKFNEGAWTETEEAALLKALMTHKWNEHSAISKIISTRSIAQIGKKMYSLARKPKIFKETSAFKIQLRQKATQLWSEHYDEKNRNQDESDSYAKQVQPELEEEQPEKIEETDNKKENGLVIGEEEENGLLIEKEEPTGEVFELESIKTKDSEPIESTNIVDSILEPEPFKDVTEAAITDEDHIYTTLLNETLKTDVTIEYNDEDLMGIVEHDSVTNEFGVASHAEEKIINAVAETVHEENTILDFGDDKMKESASEVKMEDTVAGITCENSQMEDYTVSEEVPSHSNNVKNEHAIFLDKKAVAEAAVVSKPVVKKRTRKPSNKKVVPLKSPIKLNPSAIVPKKPKRTYTRKSTIPRSSTPVNIDEDVSILSSSPSDEANSTKDSINIMSSSSEDSVQSLISSVPSINSTESDVSIKIKDGKSNDSIVHLSPEDEGKMIIGSNSIESGADDGVGVIKEWEKKACPAIFEKVTLLNPEKRYIKLKKSLTIALRRNPGITIEEMNTKFGQEFSTSSIEQVEAILKKDYDNFSVATKPRKKKTLKSFSSVEYDEMEFLKKLVLTSSGRKRKIRSDEGEWIDANEVEGRVISHEPVKPPVKEKRKRKTPFAEDLNSTEDPFRLILLNDYDCDHSRSNHNHKYTEEEEYLKVSAPFRVEMCSSVILLMDLHSHLHSSEIIGLLGGKFEELTAPSAPSVQSAESDPLLNVMPTLKINFGFPCSTSHSTGTQVDVDPLSEMEAGEYFETKSVRMAGWYHSHPNFEPNPSVRDLETQIMYQGLFKNSQPGSDIEPFVGVIVNPYLAVTESSSHLECFYVAPNLDPLLSENDRIPYRIPIQRIPFNPETFPDLLNRMREILFKADSSPDRLDMNKNAQPGVKRIDKLFKSLQFHGELNEEQMDQIKDLFK
ncbi:hypothetical protein C9890_0111, partial [Perkinsus sp. BL_2016]